MYLTRKSWLRDRLARASGDHFPGRPSFCSEFLIMTRLTEIAGAGSTAERWDLRSLDLASIAQTAETLRDQFIAGQIRRAARAFGRWSGLGALPGSLRRRLTLRRTPGSGAGRGHSGQEVQV